MNSSQAAVFLCQCLAFWDERLTASAEKTIAQGQADWFKVLRWASSHNVAPALYSSLSNSGLLTCVPADGAEFLLATWSLCRQRNRMLLSALTSACCQLNAAGIVPLLLKGAAALLPDDYPGAADRITADIDLLLPEGRSEEAVLLLRKNGYSTLYQRGESFYAAAHHEMPLLHPDFPVRLELHRRVLRDKSFDDMTALAWSRATGIEYGGAQMACPDPSWRMLHLFVHHSIADGGFAGNHLDLRRLHEFALISRHWQTELDYDWLHNYAASKNIVTAWQTWCLTRERLFAIPPPAPLPYHSSAWGKDVLVCLYVRFPILSCMTHWLRRAIRLPQRLLTPSWYYSLGIKMQALRYKLSE